MLRRSRPSFSGKSVTFTMSLESMFVETDDFVGAHTGNFSIPEEDRTDVDGGVVGFSKLMIGVLRAMVAGFPNGVVDEVLRLRREPTGRLCASFGSDLRSMFWGLKVVAIFGGHGGILFRDPILQTRCR